MGIKERKQVMEYTVIRNLPIYGHAISSVQFLLQRPEFHLLLRTSQRSNLHKRIRSRVTHGTCSVLQFIKRFGFRLLANERERVHCLTTVVFLPAEPIYDGTRKHYSVFKVLYTYSNTAIQKRKGKKSLWKRILVHVLEN
jgi:hypothetical protein